MKQVKEFLEAHEELEAMIIANNSFWCPSANIDMHSNEIYDKFMEVQKMRNELKAELGDNAKKPLSELTEEDAIKIASAAMGFAGWKLAGIIEDNFRLMCNFGSSEYRITIDTSLNFYAFESNDSYKRPLKANAVAVTDKARELGYNV